MVIVRGEPGDGVRHLLGGASGEFRDGGHRGQERRGALVVAEMPRRRCTAAFASETFESRLARNSRTENAACAAPPPVTPGADAFDPSSARARGSRRRHRASSARRSRFNEEVRRPGASGQNQSRARRARDAFDAARDSPVRDVREGE